MIRHEPADRNDVVIRFIQRIDDGEIVSLDLEGLRLISPRSRGTNDGPTCSVCGCGLLGTQKGLCTGHWDYLRVEGVDPDQRYADFLLALRGWLSRRASGLWVDAVYAGWPAVNHCRCEVCGVATSLVEQLGNDRGEILKHHFVCADHRSFRAPWGTRVRLSDVGSTTTP